MGRVFDFTSAMAATGESYVRQTSKSLDKIVKALREDVPILDMDVYDKGNKVPLDVYLTTVKSITEVDQYFTGAPSFNVWTHLPLGLTKYHEDFGVCNREAQKLLERFNAYTWNEHKQELRRKYMFALKETLWVADERFGNWKAYMGTPELTETIEIVTEDLEFSQLNGVYALRKMNGRVKEIENYVEQIPKERFFDIFTPSGWRRENKRIEMIRELEPELKKRAQDLVEPLTEVGKEYREEHTKNHYPHLL